MQRRIVLSVHEAKAAAGVAAAGARLSAIESARWEFRPLVVGEGPLDDLVRNSPLSGTAGLITASWRPGATASEAVECVADAIRASGAAAVIGNDIPVAYVAAGIEAVRGVACCMWVHADNPSVDDLIASCGETAHATRGVSGGAVERVARTAKAWGLMIPSPRVLPAPIAGADGVPLTGLHDAELKLLYVGRLERHHKRVLDLAAVLDCLHAAGVPVKLRIAGTGPDQDALEAVLGSHVHASRALLEGVVPLERVGELYAWADCLVLPSATEGMPTVVMEAAASGRPSIVTRGCGGAVELIERTCCGVVVKVGDIEAMATALAMLADDRAVLRAMGQRAARAAEGFLVRGLTGAFEQFAEEAVNRAAELGRSVEEFDGQVGVVPRVWRAQWGHVLGALGACVRNEREYTAAAERLRARFVATLRGTGAAISRDAERALPLAYPGVSHDAERRLVSTLTRLRDQGAKRIVVYGAGQHTKRLATVITRSPECVGIADDRAEGCAMTQIASVPVVAPSSVSRLRPDAIVVSSDVHERVMMTRAAAWSGGVPVVGLYSGAAAAGMA